MTNKDAAKIISEKINYKGFRTLKTFDLQIKSMKTNEYVEKTEIREVYCVGKTAFCLLYKANTDQILMCNEFRSGAFISGNENPFMLECCGGFVDEGETAKEAAIREAFEETECKVLDIELIGEMHPASSILDETATLFCGLIDTAKEGFYGLEEEAEEIKTQLFDAKELINMLDNHELSEARAIISLHWFARNHERLKEKWGS